MIRFRALKKYSIEDNLMRKYVCRKTFVPCTLVSMEIVGHKGACVPACVYTYDMQYASYMSE